MQTNLLTCFITLSGFLKRWQERNRRCYLPSVTLIWAIGKQCTIRTQECSLGRFFGKEAEFGAARGICSSSPSGPVCSRLGPTRPDSRLLLWTDKRHAAREKKAAGAGARKAVTLERDNCHDISRHSWQGPGSALGDLKSDGIGSDDGIIVSWTCLSHHHIRSARNNGNRSER